MEEKKLTVVYSCDPLNGSTHHINSPEVIAYAANLARPTGQALQ